MIMFLSLLFLYLVQILILYILRDEIHIKTHRWIPLTVHVSYESVSENVIIIGLALWAVRIWNILALKGKYIVSASFDDRVYFEEQKRLPYKLNKLYLAFKTPYWNLNFHWFSYIYIHVTIKPRFYTLSLTSFKFILHRKVDLGIYCTRQETVYFV